MDTTATRNAFLNAYSNANRKKGKAFVPLFKKTFKTTKADGKAQVEAILNIEAKEQNQKELWMKEIYKTVKMKKGGG